MSPKDIKLLLGQLAIILLILGSGLMCYLTFTNGNYRYGWLIVAWASIFIGLAVWTRQNPKSAFLSALVIYLVTIIVKDITLGGEYLLSMLFHLYFVTSMVIGMKSSHI